MYLGGLFFGCIPDAMASKPYQESVTEAMQSLVDEGLWTWVQKPPEIYKKGEKIGTETFVDDYRLWTLKRC